MANVQEAFSAWPGLTVWEHSSTITWAVNTSWFLKKWEIRGADICTIKNPHATTLKRNKDNAEYDCIQLEAGRLTEKAIKSFLVGLKIIQGELKMAEGKLFHWHSFLLECKPRLLSLGPSKGTCCMERWWGVKSDWNQETPQNRLSVPWRHFNSYSFLFFISVVHYHYTCQTL